MTSEVGEAKINSLRLSGQGIITYYCIKTGLKMQLLKNALMISDGYYIIYGKQLIIIFEMHIVGKSSRISIINSNAFNLCFFRAISKAEWPSLSGLSRFNGVKY